MGVARILPNYNYEDYLSWEGRWELIDGIPFAMSPMANPNHQRIANELGRKLAVAIDSMTCDCKVYQPIDVKISNSTIVNPDLLIVCEEIKGQFLDKPFPLAVEILSPSTRLKDQVSKYALYEAFGIKYYVMLDPKDNTVKAFQLNSDGKYEEHDGNRFDLGDCSIEVDIASAF